MRDVESGYHTVIEENISYWWAVDEDIIESCTNLMNRTENEKARSALSAIINDLRDHTEVLESMRESFRKVLSDVHRHSEMLQRLDQELHNQGLKI